jgi:hypothetical protein
MRLSSSDIVAATVGVLGGAATVAGSDRCDWKDAVAFAVATGLAVAVVLLIGAFVRSRLPNPLEIEVAEPVHRTIKGHWADVRRVVIRNPRKNGVTVEGITVALRCKEAGNRLIRLWRDDAGEHPFALNPGGEAHMRVVAEIPPGAEYWLCYSPDTGEPENLPAQPLELVIEVTVKDGQPREPYRCGASRGSDGRLDFYPA